MDRWNVYSYLKINKGKVTHTQLFNEFKPLIIEDGTDELTEGIIEYNLMAKRNQEYYNEFKGDK